MKLYLSEPVAILMLAAVLALVQAVS